jgi:hypothetical protein
VIGFQPGTCGAWPGVIETPGTMLPPHPKLGGLLVGLAGVGSTTTAFAECKGYAGPGGPCYPGPGGGLSPRPRAGAPIPVRWWRLRWPRRAVLPRPWWCAIRQMESPVPAFSSKAGPGRGKLAARVGLVVPPKIGSITPAEDALVAGWCRRCHRPSSSNDSLRLTDLGLTRQT